jgi:hypothetical protein
MEKADRSVRRNKSIIIFGYFTTLFSKIDRKCSQNTNKDTKVFNIINHIDPI